MRAASATGDSALGFASAASHTPRSCCHAGSASVQRQQAARRPPARARRQARRCPARRATQRVRGRRAAAPANRRQRLRSVGGHPPGLVRDEDQERPRRRLLERLQQRVRGRRVHRLGRRRSPRPWRARGGSSAAPSRSAPRMRSIVISSTAAWSRRRRRSSNEFEHCEVGMLAGRDVAAARARAAAPGRRRAAIRTAAPRAKLSASVRLPMPRGPAISSACGHVARVRQRLGRGRALPRQQFGPRCGDGREVVVRHQRSAARMPASSARTSATGRDESTMRKRCGSAAARSR